MGWDWERRFLSGLLYTGQSGDTLWVLSVLPEYRELLTAGLLRPLEDFGLVKCIDKQLSVFFLALEFSVVENPSCFLASVAQNKRKSYRSYNLSPRSADVECPPLFKKLLHYIEEQRRPTRAKLQVKTFKIPFKMRFFHPVSAGSSAL